LVGAESVSGRADEGPEVFRFLPDGSLDRGFARSGVARLGGQGNDVGLVPDPSGGVYMLVATFPDEAMELRHLDGDGTPERRFGTDGLVRVPLSSEPNHEVELNHPLVGLPGGGLLVAGRGGSREDRFSYRGPLELRRFSPAGHLVAAFGHDGVATVDDPRLRHFVLTDVASAAGGGILLSGTISSPRQAVVVRLGPRGRLDRRFGHEGLATPSIAGESSARAVLSRPDGSVLVGAAVARPNPRSSGPWIRRPLLLRLRKDGSVSRRFAEVPTTDYESGREAATLNVRLSNLVVVGGRAFLTTGSYAQGSGSVLTCSLRGRRERYLRLSSQGFESVAGVAARGRELVFLAGRTMDPTKGSRGFVLRALRLR
jgi:hypothetical protein